MVVASVVAAVVLFVLVPSENVTSARGRVSILRRYLLEKL